MQQVSEVIGNGLSVAVIILSVVVVLMWRKPAIKVISDKAKDPQSWFIIGVFFGFLGESLDSLYWLIVWTMHYYDHDLTPRLMSAGVSVNIVTRQAFGIIAAYCHIRSALQYNSGKSIKADKLMAAAASAGLLYSIAMILL